jgi:hypothetical protein
LSALGACGDDGDRAGGRGAQQPRASDASRQGAQSSADAAASGASADSAACPKDGRWRTCSVVERLERAGLVPLARTDTLRVAFLTPPGAGWDVARVQLRVFLYDDPTLARREGLALDPFTVAPRGQRHPWPAKATLVRSANLVAVLLSDNDRQIERVQLALEAGTATGRGGFGALSPADIGGPGGVAATAPQPDLLQIVHDRVNVDARSAHQLVACMRQDCIRCTAE